MAERSESRLELKYPVNGNRRSELLTALRLHGDAFYEHHPTRRVNSIYFDTPGFQDLTDTVEGMSERSKLRLRWYGDTNRMHSGTVEWKRKRGTTSWKRTNPSGEFECDLDGSVTWSALRDGLMRAVDPELGNLLAGHSLPVVVITYLRDYLVTADGALRVTVDSQLAAYSQIVTPGPTLAYPLFLQPITVLELKAPTGSEHRIRAVVDRLPGFLGRISKYKIAAEAALAP